ncbi:GNAT superfamily N-acetyltransferase [Amycolatopsis lexingtonensis]|uniref:GNAT superfamily N-acetyltransferase n=1 Tax=Amycolatopsis lexingtonensis TaxID=218822 RepID=A0ABR9HZK7_9PSEU|nr:GNAT family N-acetyltransferase [Amycolatopsis lexingtonensis]MBE1496369.1 GNAT superfamily N-acetyltransferase [Amycolatopsis lexingtonensis]
MPTAYRSVRLTDGRQVSIDLLTPADAPELGTAIEHADPETRYRRFRGPPPRAIPKLLRRLTELDHERRYALVARAPDGHGAAVARYEATAEPGVADVAVVVDPAWRHAGLATALVRMLGEAAVAHGFTKFTATCLADNVPVGELLDEAGGHSGASPDQPVGRRMPAVSHAEG